MTDTYKILIYAFNDKIYTIQTTQLKSSNDNMNRGQMTIQSYDSDLVNLEGNDNTTQITPFKTKDESNFVLINSSAAEWDTLELKLKYVYLQYLVLELIWPNIGNIKPKHAIINLTNTSKVSILDEFQPIPTHAINVPLHLVSFYNSYNRTIMICNMQTNEKLFYSDVVEYNLVSTLNSKISDLVIITKTDTKLLRLRDMIQLIEPVIKVELGNRDECIVILWHNGAEYRGSVGLFKNAQSIKSGKVLYEVVTKHLSEIKIMYVLEDLEKIRMEVTYGELLKMDPIQFGVKMETIVVHLERVD